MAKQSHKQDSTNNSVHSNDSPNETMPSALTKFSLSFEYDRTWAEAKQTIQHRPLKK